MYQVHQNEKSNAIRMKMNGKQKGENPNTGEPKGNRRNRKTPKCNNIENT